MPSSGKRVYRRINPEWHSWARAVKQARKLVRHYEDYQSPHGVKWTNAMRANYQRKLDALLADEPTKYRN